MYTRRRTGIASGVTARAEQNPGMKAATPENRATAAARQSDTARSRIRPGLNKCLRLTN